jgi:hypothetical protein
MSNNNHILVSRSVNEVICHGIPDLRPLEDADIVNGKNIRKNKSYTSYVYINSRY